MTSVLLCLWNKLFSVLPSYSLRKVLFTAVMKNSADSRISIHMNLRLTTLGGIRIGGHSTINRNVLLDSRGPIVIGDRVSISPEVLLITASHDMNSVDFALTVGGITIEDYVWIGTRAIILPGVTLGKGAVVGAGSVVTKDVPPFTFVAGNPATKIRERIQTLDYSPLWKPYLQ